MLGGEKFCSTHAFLSLEMWKTSLQVFPQFKDVYFFLLTGLQFKHVNCTSSLHSGAKKFCTTHALSRLKVWKTCIWFLPVLPQFKDAFFSLLTGLHFKHLHHLHSHGNDILSKERQYGTWNILRERKTIIISWIWLNGLHTYWEL